MSSYLLRILTPAQRGGFGLVFEDWELALLGDEEAKSRLAQLRPLVGPTAFEIIRCARLHPNSIVALETAAKMQSRSAKVILPIIGDFLETILQERDLHIY